MESPILNKNWKALNDLEEAFSKISIIEFLSGQLQEAVDSNDKSAILDASLALNAFLPVYIEHYDQKFREAWDVLINND